MRLRSILGASSILALTAGLVLPASGTAQQRGEQEPAPRSQDVALRVDNHNWLDMHVYVSRSGGPLRSLGMVTSMTSEVFYLPADVAMAGTDLRIIADPIGGSGIYVSQPVLANPRTEIVLTVQNALELSYTSVGPRRDSD